METKKLSMAELNRIDIEQARSKSKKKFSIVVDNVRSGQNVGSIFRSADAFGAHEIIIVGLSPFPPNKEVLKTALGATESVAWKYIESIEDTIIYLKQQDYNILVIEQTNASLSLNDFVPVKVQKYALVLGNEVDGVSQMFINHATTCLEIPQVGVKHSLNVSVCAGIVMWHLFNQE